MHTTNCILLVSAMPAHKTQRRHLHRRHCRRPSTRTGALQWAEYAPTLAVRAALRLSVRTTWDYFSIFGLLKYVNSSFLPCALLLEPFSFGGVFCCLHCQQMHSVVIVILPLVLLHDREETLSNVCERVRLEHLAAMSFMPFCPRLSGELLGAAPAARGRPARHRQPPALGRCLQPGCVS
jgi:hypothetical protein